MAQLSIRFVSPGTRSYTVGNDVVGGVMKMEAIGAGGAGGTAAVNSGGGGKGGAYARRNAQAVVSGQSLTITVPPAATTTAGAVATVGLAGGQTTYSVPSYTFTYNATPSGTAVQSTPVCFTVNVVGGVFISSQDYGAPASGQSVSLPTSQVGDVIFLLSSGNASQKTLSPQGFSLLDFDDQGNSILCYLYAKVAVQGDSGASVVLNDANESGNWSASVVRPSSGGSYSYIGRNKSVSANSTSVISTAYSAQMGDLAVYFTSAFIFAGSVANSVSPPAAVSERAEYPPAGSTTGAAGGKKDSINTAPMVQNTSTATTLLSARGGAVGGNGSATAGGTGATAQNGTFTGDVEFTGGNGTNGTLTAGGNGGGGAGDSSNTTGAGPNTQFGVSRGQGGGSAAAGTAFGGAGGGATTLAARGAGAQGIVVLTYSTGVGAISHTARFNRKLTLFRRVVASITNLAVFNRKVTLRRMAVATITHVSRALKTIKLRKTASVTHLAAYTRKALRLRKTASITHVALIRRALRVLRTASITNTAVFKRLVTLRRRFVASITLRARMLVKLEARLIPREGGGGTVTNVFRNLFLFDD